jgi:peptidoglycan pentaglycine glycine transferase (the first glycine)
VLTPQFVTDPTEWTRAITHLPGAHVLQSWEWGAFKAEYGWAPTRVLFFEGERLQAAAQVLRRPLPRTPFGVSYVPKGPILDYGNSSLFDQTLAALEKIGRAQHAIFVKIDPDLAKAAAESPSEKVLSTRAWRASREQIQFKNTMLLDLAQSEAQLLALMKPKTRYNIRLAEKHGVQVEAGGCEDLPLFYAMYAETSERDGFLIRHFPYYRQAWGSFIQADRAQMFLARVGEETVAGLILFCFSGRAWYFYGASRSAHREAMPNHLLQWHAIRWAKAQGCTTYDFWGAPDALDQKSPMQGVYRFKAGFGARFAQHVGAYDFVIHPSLYYLYAVVRPWYLAKLRAKANPPVL